MTNHRKRLVLVGLGGLGGPAALALTALAHKDVELVLIDPDVVELSNLHRQVCYGMTDLGLPKAEVLAQRLRARGVTCTPHRTRVEPGNIDQLLDGAWLVMEGSDQFSCKFLVNDWCTAHQTPLMIASAQGYQGHVFAVLPGGTCYRCVFEAPPEEEEALTCAGAGVLGPVCGVVAGTAVRMIAAMERGAGLDCVAHFWQDMRRSVEPRAIAPHVRAGCPCHDAMHTSGPLDVRENQLPWSATTLSGSPDHRKEDHGHR